MGLKRNVSLATGLKYKGQGPMLTFVLHRIGGLGMAIFISVHILSSFLGGDIGKFLNDVYENWAFQIVIFFCVLFHAINGLRITILDLWPKSDSPPARGRLGGVGGLHPRLQFCRLRHPDDGAGRLTWQPNRNPSRWQNAA